MRAFNFGAGPATLPEAILKQAQADMLEWQGLGMSVMEVNHRTAPIKNLIDETIENLTRVLDIPKNYRVLFLTAPSRQQFAMVPMNILGKKNHAAYFDTGIWSEMAIHEAQKYTQVECVVSSKTNGYTTIPAIETWQVPEGAAYLHYTANETVNGVEFPFIPEAGNLPLVVDMTSNILSQPVDVSQFGIIYAGAQKNIGPAGLTIVIIRDDLLDFAPPTTPTVLTYKYIADMNSLCYTPNAFAIYMANLMFQWVAEQGGVETMDERARHRSKQLYDFIDQSDFYENTVDPAYRSRINIPFWIKDKSLEDEFSQHAQQAGLLQLKGHKAVGGFRASFYNAMSDDGVNALLAFMREFSKK